MFLGMAYLFHRQGLSSNEIVGAGALLLAISGLSSVLLPGLWRPGLLRMLLEAVQSCIEGLDVMLKKQSPLGKDWAATNSEGFMNATRAIEARPSGLVHTVSLAMLAHLINISQPLLCIFGL